MKNIKVGQKFKRTGNWATGVTNKDIATVTVTVTYLLEDGGVRYEYADGFSAVDNPDAFFPDEETFVNSGKRNGFVFVEDLPEIEVGQKWKLKQDIWGGACNLAVGDVVTVEKAVGEDIYYAPGAFLDRGWLSEQGFLRHFELVEDLPPEVQYRELPDWGTAYKITLVGTVARKNKYEVLIKSQSQNKTWDTTWIGESNIEATEPITKEEFDNFLPVEEKSENDPVSPNVYQFPTCEVRDISAHLTSFGGQATQYIARSTRLDGVVKDDPVQDLRKAIQLLEWEIERIEDNK